MDLFRFIPGYTSAIYDDGKEPLFLLLLGFLITFALTRAYTRIARVRGWGSANVGGVHMHHVVPGVLLMLSVGLIDFAFAPGEVVRDVLAIAFGVGAALMLDEFAMIFHIEDVYWSPEGRSSVDAVIFVVVITIMLLISSTSSFEGDAGGWALVVTILLISSLSIIAVLKGKLKMAVLGIIFLVFSLVAACRLAKPDSWWARRFYNPERSRRAAKKHARAIKRAEQRGQRWDGRRLRFYDLVGGAPHRNLPPEADKHP